jgi:RNA polymerase sigma factor (TIGR02999 family)
LRATAGGDTLYAPADAFHTNNASNRAENRHDAVRDWMEQELGADRRALDDLFSATYEELRRLAATVRRGDPSATLSPTALVNEAWLKLAASPHVAQTSPLHFKRIAARAMRQVLVEAARRRSADKRGGGDAVVTFDESVADAPVCATCADELLALDAALDDLARIQPRQALLVESRFFGGFDLAETAALLQISESTALRDWRAAKAWLALELRTTN